jgi:hypothetical protein
MRQARSKSALDDRHRVWPGVQTVAADQRLHADLACRHERLDDLEGFLPRTRQARIERQVGGRLAHDERCDLAAGIGRSRDEQLRPDRTDQFRANSPRFRRLTGLIRCQRFPWNRGRSGVHFQHHLSVSMKERFKRRGDEQPEHSVRPILESTFPSASSRWVITSRTSAMLPATARTSLRVRLVANV